MSETRLYRSVHGRVIGGVAGGLADFFGIDPTIIRLIFVLLVIFGGSGVLIYIILWIILPEKNQYNTFYGYTTPPPSPGSSDSGVGETYEGFEEGSPRQPLNQNKETADTMQRRKMDGSLIGGLLLIFFGSIFLIERFVANINFSDLWPIALIIIGLVLIFGNLPWKPAAKSGKIETKAEATADTDNSSQTN